MTSVGTKSHDLSPFFGQVEPQYQKMLAEDKFAHETYNLPKAYEGKNKHLESVLVDEDTAALVGHGRVLPLEQLQVSGAGPWAVLGEDGALLAVYESHPQGGKPTVVIPR